MSITGGAKSPEPHSPPEYIISEAGANLKRLGSTTQQKNKVIFFLNRQKLQRLLDDQTIDILIGVC